MSQDNSWFASTWRPLVAYTYIVIVLFDFIVGPIIWMLLHTKLSLPPTAYTPLTLQAGGMFHLSMGAVMGVSSYTRGMEKVEAIKQQAS